MSSRSLNQSFEQNQVVLRMQYECKLKDDAISKATRLIQQLQEEVSILKADKESIRKQTNKKNVQIQQLHNRHRQLEDKIIFLQDCINQKDKQITQLYQSIDIKKEREEKKQKKEKKQKRQEKQKNQSQYLTISYKPQRHRSERRMKETKQGQYLNSDYLNSTQSIGTPIKSTKKKYVVNTSPDQEPTRFNYLSNEMIDLKRQLHTKDKHNLYLLKRNKAIQDYLSIIDDVNSHPILRRQPPILYRGGYLL